MDHLLILEKEQIIKCILTALRSSISAAFNQNINPRNTEDPWYGVWLLALEVYITFGWGNLIINPQYRLPQGKVDTAETDLPLPDSEDDDMQSIVSTGSSGSNDPLDLLVVTPPGDPQAADRKGIVGGPRLLLDVAPAESFTDQGLLEVGDISFDSEKSYPEKNKSYRAPDFVIRYWDAEVGSKGAIKNTNHKVPCIVEVKRSPSRQLIKAALPGVEDGVPALQEDVQALQDDVFNWLSMAQRDAIEQATRLFQEQTNQNSVLCCAASGPWFTYKIITREHVNPSTTQSFTEADYQWSPAHRLTTTKANAAFQSIRDALFGEEGKGDKYKKVVVL